jgi:hypothetical protein
MRGRILYLNTGISFQADFVRSIAADALKPAAVLRVEVQPPPITHGVRWRPAIRAWIPAQDGDVGAAMFQGRGVTRSARRRAFGRVA